MRPDQVHITYVINLKAWQGCIFGGFLAVNSYGVISPKKTKTVTNEKFKRRHHQHPLQCKIAQYRRESSPDRYLNTTDSRCEGDCSWLAATHKKIISVQKKILRHIHIKSYSPDSFTDIPRYASWKPEGTQAPMLWICLHVYWNTWLHLHKWKQEEL